LANISIVIPHYSGEAALRRCLHSLRRSRARFRDFEIVLVDNGSRDGSTERAERRFPEIRIVRSPVNLGFAGGCNLGIRSSAGEFVVLLNDDAEADPGWLGPLVRTAQSDPRIGAVQPKLLSHFDRRRFDYCGAAGGEMDVFGYPFARGRLFDFLEEDSGQYDIPASVFWASGAAVLLRRSALERVGLLDESFFAHMEEIDLDFRLHWAGYRIVTQPESVVFHRTGGTLGQGDVRKMVLNHRNSLLLLLKNYSAETLCWVFPLRLSLEALTFFASVFRGDWKRAAAVPAGLFGALRLWKTVADGRRLVARIRVRRENEILRLLTRKSAAIEHFVLGKTKASEIRDFNRPRPVLTGRSGHGKNS
jgi:GT2 family glycosyltransferase